MGSLSKGRREDPTNVFRDPLNLPRPGRTPPAFRHGWKRAGTATSSSFGETIDSLDVTCESGSYRLAPMYVSSGTRGETSDGTQLNQMIAHQQAKQMDDESLCRPNRERLRRPGNFEG
jgi:hypothetical protein